MGGEIHEKIEDNDILGKTYKQARSRIGEKKYKNLTITVVRCND